MGRGGLVILIRLSVHIVVVEFNNHTSLNGQNLGILLTFDST
jgi:hypothetical protein